MESSAAAAPGAPVAIDRTAPGAKGLKTNAIGYVSNVVIGVASTAPAYSLATTLGFIVIVPGLGTHAPAVLIVAFIPMLFIAAAYRYLNLADPDAGTSFAWGTRAMGPQMGWINGWAIFLADVIVMASLADIASTYTFSLVGWTSAQNSTTAIIIGSIVWIALMTWICYRGIELSAHLQTALLCIECLILGIFSVVALINTYNGLHGSFKPQFDWFNPFGLSATAFTGGILLAIFIYWGWDSGVAVNEESEDAAQGPGKAAVLSTVLLVLIYVLVATAAQADAGPHFLGQNSADVLSAMGKRVFGGGILDKLLLFSVLTSASASTQTTILPTARTTISMASWGALPKVFARVHPRYKTPSVSTLAMGGISIIWTVALLLSSTPGNILGDSITGLGFSILFYYGLTGLACVIYYRHELLKSWRRFLLVGVVPFAGFGGMTYVFVKSFITVSKAGNNYSPPLLGIQLPIVIGIGGLLLGVVFLAAQWAFMPQFFRRRPETANPAILDEQFAAHVAK
ncbi:MAG TPA: APC family permease [Solirubrobacteraceae bacterium]|nr:APC family permease [Solirubrobacteraceae bacterium]